MNLTQRGICGIPARIIFCLGFFLSFNVSAEQEWQRGFVQLSSGSNLYTEYRPAAAGKPTLVFLNGLTHSTKDWQALLSGLHNQDYGLLLYDARGQGRTLQNDSLDSNKLINAYKDIINFRGIAMREQIRDLNLLLDELDISGPVDLIGLSYGGGMSIMFANKYPQRVRQIIAMAPYVVPLKEQDQLIRKWVERNYGMPPYFGLTEEQLYDIGLWDIVFTTYPVVEPSIFEFPQKIFGVFQMVREMRKFIAEEHVAHLPAGSLNLVVAGKDEYIPVGDHNNFWNAVPAAARGSRLDIQNMEHKMIIKAPRYMAAWVEKIVLRDSRIRGGIEFVGNPETGTAVSGDTIIDLK